MRAFLLLLSVVAVSICIFAYCGKGYQYQLSPADASLTIITICTTIIVGISVIDTLRIQEVEKRIKKLEKLERQYETLKSKMQIGLHVAWGMAYLNWRPYKAFGDFLTAYRMTLSTGDVLNADACLQRLEQTVRTINACEKKNNEQSVEFCVGQEEIPESPPTEVTSAPYYRLFKKRTEKVFQDINKKQAS